MKHRKPVLYTAIALIVSTAAVMGSVTFAWFQAEARVQIQTTSSSANITVQAPDQELKIEKITVIGDTTTGITPSTTAHETTGNVYEIALSDTRKLTDVSGDASYESDGSTPVTPVSLFKPVFASNYDASNVGSGYATIYDVSDSTDSFSDLTTGVAYPYVRFGFKIQNISGAQKSVYATYTLHESTNMHIARASVCQLNIGALSPTGTDFSSVARTAWTEKAYVATESQAVTPICANTDDPGYSYVVDSSAASIAVSGETFSSYLGYPKTSNDASDGYSPNTAVTTLAANAYAFFSVTIWVEGQDPDCWSNTSISNNITCMVQMY